MNAALPPSERILLARDPICSTPYVDATNVELVAASFIAVGAYTERKRDAQLRASRLPGYLMLERYFAWCRAMWEQVVTLPMPEAGRTERDAAALNIDSHAYRAGAAVGHWLGSLCPVIEGWDELRLTDPTIDALLADGEAKEYRDRLFRFRNGVFHYQRSSTDSKFVDFMDETGDARLWAVRLERAFLRFFTDHAANGYEALDDWLRR